MNKKGTLYYDWLYLVSISIKILHEKKEVLTTYFARS